MSIEEYQDEKIRRQISSEIKGLELPPEWRPHEVIRYIIKIIEKGLN